jgi:hypothetical protein
MSGYRISLSPEALMARAREKAGVDLVDTAAIEPLALLHRSLCEEAQLSEEGAKGHERKLLRLLTNRLRMQRDYADHPEIAAQKIKGPLIVMGMARSGTTKTQKVLAVSGDFNWLPFWQTHNWASVSGHPHEATEGRIRDADEWCSWFAERSPEAKFGHPFETFEPEEDTLLCEGSLVAASFIGYGHVPSYLQWVAIQPTAQMFEFLRDVMKYLQWQGLASADRTWLLKSPLYNGLEPEILKVFPDARFVMAHRTPLKTLPSACKLAQCFRRPYSDAACNQAMLVEGYFHTIGLHMVNRVAYPDWPLLDISFDEISHAWPTTAERIYARAGLTLTASARQRMQQWELDNVIHKHGEFKYSLEEFGLSSEQVRRNMASYLAFLESRFGG